MPPVPTADSGTHRTYNKVGGTEPLPGYLLLEPLGRGGFGEVWKCEAPGGLHKAIKFVPPTAEGHQLRQELAAFEQIKAIRHPFLLTLERVELINDELVMVMELADRQLADRQRDCAAAGLPGIPRDELLGYLADAAEALDMIAAQYGLQHLDVKPANLFLTAGRVKVGDYGLVSRLEGAGKPDGNRGLTPKYVAPEVLKGAPSPRSDQYSLALVYFELLTGGFPYPARNPQHLMMMHVTAAPDLSALPECDRAAVNKALAKKPDDRFGFCLEFVRALMTADTGTATSPNLAFRRARLDRTSPDLVITPGPRDSGSASGTSQFPGLAERTQNATVPSVARMTSPGKPLPPLVAAGRRPATPPPPPPPPPPDDDLPMAEAEEIDTPRVILDPIRSVVPVVRLLGPHWAEVPLTASDLTSMVVEAAANGTRMPQMPGDLAMLADGTWVCQFPTTVPATVAPLKLEVVRDYWGMVIEQPEPCRIVMRKGAPGSLWGSLSGRGRGGLEINIQLPRPGKPVGEITARGTVFGQPTPDFVRSALDAIPKILTDVRRELANVTDRRKHPRIAADFPVSIYPIHSDGGIDPAVRGQLHDVSVGGLCFGLRATLQTKYVFAAFDSLPQTVGLAILVRLVRSRSEPSGERIYGAEYRTDL